MDAAEKVELVSRPPTEEVVTQGRVVRAFQNQFKAKTLHWH